MKKIILSLALLAGISGAASAQTGLKAGLKGGVNLSSFSGTDAAPFGYKYGFSAGGLLNYGVTDNISIQLELLYSQKGTNSDLDFSNYTTGTTVASKGNLKQTLQYVDIPLLFKYNLGEAGKGLFFEIGPQGSLVAAQRTFSDDANVGLVAALGALSNGSGDGYVPVNNSSSPTAADTKAVPFGNSTDGLNKLVVGYVGGIGYQLTSGLGFGVRYTGDVSQVYKDTKFVDGTSPVNVHSSVFQFQVHYLFGGK